MKFVSAIARQSEKLTQWALPIGIIAVWEVLSLAGVIPLRVLPAPTAVIAAGWHATISGELPRNIWVSFWRAIVGLLVGGGFGFALGLANGLSKRSERIFDSTLQMIRNIPHLALIPLVILWFGIDEEAKIFLVALGVFFPIYINTSTASAPSIRNWSKWARTYGMSASTLFWRVILPGALPSIFVGLRYALGIMWLTLIVAETISASSGIGYMAMQAREFLLVDVVVLSILIYALLGKLADSVARLLERWCLAWHPAFQGPSEVKT